MVRGLRLFLVSLFLLAALPVAHSQNGPSEFHLADDVARRLYVLSAFAHGHRHGYEEGFRAADTEIHLGGLRRELREKDIPRSMGYKRSYGKKSRFREGFIYGFLAGYNDSHEARGFRLPEWTADIPPFAWMSDLPQSDAPASAGLDPAVRTRFDEGMLHGYRAGVTTPTVATDSPTLAAQAAAGCASQPRPPEQGYCDGFTQGFLLGAGDRLSVSPSPASDWAKYFAPPQ